MISLDIFVVGLIFNNKQTFFFWQIYYYKDIDQNICDMVWVAAAAPFVNTCAGAMDQLLQETDIRHENSMVSTLQV